MKKYLLFSLVVASCFFSCNFSSAEEEIITSNADNSKTENIIFSSEKYKIIEENGKFAIIDTKTNKNKIGMLAESIELFDDEFENEYKLKLRNTSTNNLIIGYYNTETDNLLITPYEDMSLLGDYLKVKSNNKYGLIDKNGKTLLMPMYDRVGTYTQDGKEYLSAKINGKNHLYYKTGELIPEDELYSVSYDGIYAITTDIKPELKKYLIKTKSASYLTNSKPKVEEAEEVEKTEAAESAANIDEINKLEPTENIQTAAIEENVVNDNQQTDNIDKKNILLNKKEYIVVNDGSKIGLTDIKGKEIIPTVYEKMNIIQQRNPIILTKANGKIYVFDIKGKLLAEENNGKVNIYKYGKLYTYTSEDDQYVLKSNDKKIGTLKINDSDYIFVKQNFNLLNYKKINDMLLEILYSFDE